MNEEKPLTEQINDLARTAGPATIEEFIEQHQPGGGIADRLLADVPKERAVADNVVELDRHAWKKREKSLKALGQEQRVVVKGGARMVKFNVTMPFEQFRKMCERFQGATPGEKVNLLAKIANQRIDMIERKQVADALNGIVEPKKP